MSETESEDGGQMQSIATRISCLNQMFMGRSPSAAIQSLAGRESLMDALLGLYNECNNTHFMRNQYISSFVKKYSKTVAELRRLRISVTDFNVKNTIGRGHFGEVQVVREKHSGDVYALKVLRKTDTLAQQNVAFYEEERDIMAKATSPWITELQYAFQDHTNLYLVMEFHPGGDLLSLLARFDDVFEEKMVRFYLAEMVLAIHTLHTMGYVHRDVKPENILIDRTGHIKLADFGSACKLAASTASVANMPVGTPDYICPEVLMKMNSDQTVGQFGEECDWWSLGICAYEMLYGKTPFTDENGSMVVTYANIMNHKKCLKFPNNGNASPEMVHLITNLLTDSICRLRYESICVHSFFSDIDFDNIRQMTPPFIPTVTSSDDTSNFDEFEKAKRGPEVEDFTKKTTSFTGRDLPFVGFTYTKALKTQERPSLSMEVSSPAAKASLERRLQQKSRELTEIRERCKDLEHKNTSGNTEVTRLRSQLSDREARLDKLEADRRTLELEKAHYMTEVKSLTRLLEMEKQDQQQTEEKAMTLLEDIRKQSEVATALREQTNTQELAEHQQLISELEDENKTLCEKIERLERGLADETAAHYDVMAKNEVMKQKMREYKKLLRDRESSGREQKVQQELDKANEQRFEAVELLATMRLSKTKLEDELYSLRRKSSLHATLEAKLVEAEEARQSMEMHLHRLELTEKREEALRQQLTEKSKHVAQMAEKIAEVEDCHQTADLEHRKQMKLAHQREQQLTERIQELESVAERMRYEQSSLEDQSLHVYEENEMHLQRIHQQEQTINAMKSNITKLEAQMQSLRTEMEKGSRRSTPCRRRSQRVIETQTESLSPLKVTSRRSGFSQTDTPPWKSLRHVGQRTGFTQTDTSTAAKRSIDCQFGGQSQRSRSDGVQTNLNGSLVSPGRTRSNQMQTDVTPRRSNTCQTDDAGLSPNITSRRHSKNTQTDMVRRRSNNMQTEVTVRVSMCSGPDSPIPQSTDTSVSTETETSPKANTEDSVLSTDRPLIEPIPEEDCLSEDDEEDEDDIEEVEGSGTDEESIDLNDSSNLENDTDTSRVHDQSLNTTVIHCGQGDTQKVKEGSELLEKTHKKEEPQAEKEKKRRLEEDLSDLRQEKAYLELKVTNLEDEVAHFKDSTHEQRIRALDLKHELREKSAHLECEVVELKEKLNQAQLALSDAQETAANCEQKEKTMRNKLEKLQLNMDTMRIDSRRKLSELQVAKDDFDAEVKALKSKVATLEPKESELRRYMERCEELEPKNKEMERQLQVVQEERTKLKMDLERQRDELQQKGRDCDLLKQQVDSLKTVCSEQDGQLQEYETLTENWEKKASKWTSHKETYKKAVDEREVELEDSHKGLTKEKQAKQKAEAQVRELTGQLEVEGKGHHAQVATLKCQLNELKDKLKCMAGQLTSLEKANSHLDVDLRTAQRHMEATNEDNIRLKEESSNLITTISEVKASNLKLSKTLEESMDRYELLASQNTDLQNRLETQQSSYNHEKYKMQATISQQTKLIDYLQIKVENPPKKKKGLFGSKKLDNSAATAGIQFREMQHSLEHERDKNATLRQTITKLQTELYQAKTAASPPISGNSALASLTLSPASQPISSGVSGSYSTPKIPATSRPKKERMHHNIPHRFVTGLNSRATKCAVCLGSVHFVKQAAKCQECEVVAHPKCAASLPASCGLPTEYATHFSKMMTQASQSSSRLSVADLRLHMKAWMKMPRPGKQLWEKKFVVLEDNQIHVYNTEDTKQDHVEEFDLCPANGTITVHSAVTAAELTNTATSDLPYILRLEFEPETTCWPGRSIYLMALSFEDKQKWVATLEAIVDHSHNSVGRREAKLLGNTIVSLSGDRRLEINCTLPLSDQVILVGTDEGLYMVELGKNAGSRPLTKITGLAAVYQMEPMENINQIVMITGKDRQVVLVNGEELEKGVGSCAPAVTPYQIDEAVACTTLAAATNAGDTFLCATLAEKILVLQYDFRQGAFVIRKELLTSQPCSCLYFGKRDIIIGADKFHKISLQTFEISDFLDKKDSTLAFAAFGAAHYDSFPISVLQVAPPEDPNEFLLCYHEFGVFVDSNGKRSREDDMKWSGLPLAFAYSKPYLYIIHFNSVQVLEIPASHHHHSEGGKTVLTLANPRYLGRALTRGAVYIGSAHDNTTEILCFRGNMISSPPEDKENLYSMPKKKSPKRPLVESTCSSVDHGFVSPEQSPPVIHQLVRSPTSSLSRRKVAKMVTPTYTSTSSSDQETESSSGSPSKVTVEVDIKAKTGHEKRRRYSYKQSCDTSFGD